MDILLTYLLLSGLSKKLESYFNCNN